MRPRPEGRGEHGNRAVGCSATDDASMRPRPEGRGERPRRRLADERLPLQCGHDPKAVENVGTVDAMPTGSRLQCGHDPKAVENRRASVSRAAGE